MVIKSQRKLRSLYKIKPGKRLGQSTAGEGKSSFFRSLAESQHNRFTTGLVISVTTRSLNKREIFQIKVKNMFSKASLKAILTLV